MPPEQPPERPPNDNNDGWIPRNNARVILYSLVAFAIIFIDFESNTLGKYAAPQIAETRETALVADETQPNLGLMQNNQLQQQWMEYESRATNQTTPPEEGGEVVVTIGENKEEGNDKNSSPSNDLELVKNETSDSTNVTTHIDSNKNGTLVILDDEQNTTSLLNENKSSQPVTTKKTEDTKNETRFDSNGNNTLNLALDDTQNTTQPQNEDNSSSDLTMEEIENFKNRIHAVSNQTSIDNKRNTTASTMHHKSEDRDNCFVNNSKAWQRGPRWSNAASSYDDNQFIVENPLEFGQMSDLLSSSICNQNSKFLNPKQSYWDVTDDALIDEWEFRLLYLAIHHHHHAPALGEKETRLKTCSSSSADYECPSARFLVTTLPGAGLGAVFRTAGLMSLLMGVATNRITVFVNNYVPEKDSINATESNKPPYSFLKKPSTLFSCPRRDMQCVFLPTSPCVLTQEALQSGVLMPEVDARDLRRQGKLNKQEYNDAHVLIIEPRISTPKAWSIQYLIQDRLYNIAKTLISKLPTDNDEDLQKIAVLEAAAKRILKDDATIGYHENNATNDFVYSNRYTKTAHAALLYLMRPNPYYQQLSEKIVDQTFTNKYSGGPSFGLPIRGSDKCHRESECLEFDNYMNLTRDEIRAFTMNETTMNNATKVHNTTTRESKKPTVILTTEDKAISRARRKYEKEFDFVINEHDIFQGTGKASNYGDRADDIMLSSMVALKMQFLATQKVVGNCCSNFHLLLFDLLNEQCGLSSKPLCLQEHPNPNYRLCCQWTKSEACEFKREAIKAEKEKEVKL